MSGSALRPPEEDFVVDEAQLAAVAFRARYGGRTLDACRHDLRGLFRGQLTTSWCFLQGVNTSRCVNVGHIPSSPSVIGLINRTGPRRKEERMSPQVVMSLGVTDIEQAKRFYSDVFGWPIEWDHGKFVSFQLGDGTGMGLYTGEAVAFDASLAVDGTYRGVTFSWIVDTTEQVDEVMAQAERKGATFSAGRVR
jgi:predicted enzyme related to lactoylglutathione lyase